MRLIAVALLAGGTLMPADGLPNPMVGECAIADIVVTRDEPTFINPDGAVTGLRIWQVCGYQVPDDTGTMRAADDTFITEVDLDDAAVLVEAATDLLANDNVYPGS